MNFSSADLLIVGGNHSWIWFGLSCFFLFAVAIEGFYICMPLEGYNGPLKAGYANWIRLVLGFRSISIHAISSKDDRQWLPFDLNNFQGSFVYSINERINLEESRILAIVFPEMWLNITLEKGLEVT